eukprot:jgi/Hompol1/6844/HPOL_000477-RA
MAAGVYAIDRVWSIPKNSLSLLSLETLGSSILAAKDLNDQGSIFLRLASVLRNADQNYEMAARALEMCSILMNTAAVDNASHQVALESTMSSHAQNFALFIPMVIQQAIGRLSQASLDVLPQTFGALSNLCILSRSHPNFFQSQDVEDVVKMALCSTLDLLDQYKHVDAGSAALRRSMRSLGARIIRRLGTAYPELLANAAKSSRFAVYLKEYLVWISRRNLAVFSNDNGAETAILFDIALSIKAICNLDAQFVRNCDL